MTQEAAEAAVLALEVAAAGTLMQRMPCVCRGMVLLTVASKRRAVLRAGWLVPTEAKYSPHSHAS